jgi:hypothetical protein
MADKPKPVAECVDAYTRSLRESELPRAYCAILFALSAFKTA